MRTGFWTVRVSVRVCKRNEFCLMTLIRNRDKGFWHKLNTMAKNFTSKLNDWLINDSIFIDFANLNSYKLFTVNVCGWRAIEQTNEWTVQTTEKLADMIQPYDSQSNKNVFLFFFLDILIGTALHDFEFNELLLQILCTHTLSPHTHIQIVHLSSISTLW